MKALITYYRYDYKGTEQTEVNFPLIFEHDYDEVFLKNQSIATSENLLHVDVVPEEEYFLTSDGLGNTYIVPTSRKERWLFICCSRDFLDDFEGDLNAEFGQYRVEGDWEKQFKITKR